jgi:hypothetical protein
MRMGFAAKLGLGIALFGAAPAFAETSASLAVQSVVEPACAFTSKPAATVTVTPTAGEKFLGDLGYTCNFVGQPHLTLQLPGGTRLVNPANGGDSVTYGIRWLVAPNGPGTAYQSFAPGDVLFEWVTYVANSEMKGALQIRLPAALGVAGLYSTTISYTIVP